MRLLRDSSLSLVLAVLFLLSGTTGKRQAFLVEIQRCVPAPSRDAAAMCLLWDRPRLENGLHFAAGLTCAIVRSLTLATDSGGQPAAVRSGIECKGWLS